MNLLRVDHTALVVRDMDDALTRYARLYGLHASERINISEQGVEAAFLDIGDTKLELIRPLDPTSGVGRYLEKHGEGLHHVGILVADIRRELRHLEEEGARLIDREPRRGAHGLVAFVHPKSSAGVLVELVEHVGNELLQA